MKGPCNRLSWVLLALLLLLPAGEGIGVQRQTGSALAPIVGNDKLLGGVRKGTWLPEEKVYGWVKGGEKYRFYTLSSLESEAVGGKAEFRNSEGQHGYYINFTYPSGYKNTEETTIGIAAPWNPQPRKPRIQDVHQPVYLRAIAEVLKNKGLTRAIPHIRRIVRIDLDGKGTDSVLIEAASPDEYGEGPVMPLSANSYSFVLLRTVAEGKLHSNVVAGVFYKQPPTHWTVERIRLLTVLDLNGDGAMEIVTYAEGHEDFDYTIHQITKGNVKVALMGGDGV